jgi:hypothetical protein
MEAVLWSMYDIALHTLPEDEPWSLDDFLARTRDHAQQQAKYLHSKSQVSHRTTF